MNPDVKDFLERNNIDAMELSTREYGRVKSREEINEIVYKYGFYKPKQIKEISIADIIGYDYDPVNDNPFIAYGLDSFFNSKGDSYHSRCMGLLEYTAEDAMDKINFEREKIVVDEMGNNQYVISQNGLHRYMVLRILYLSEYIKISKDEEQMSRLKEKYKIPVEVRELEEVKTYSKYMLMDFDCGIKDIELEYDEESWKPTGRLVIRKENKENILIENEEQLIEYVKQFSTIFNQNIENLQQYYSKYPAFREYLNTYYTGILNIEQLEENNIEMEYEEIIGEW